MSLDIVIIGFKKKCSSLLQYIDCEYDKHKPKKCRVPYYMLKNIYSPFLSDSGHNRKVFLYFNDFFFVVNTTKIFPILSNLPLQDNINYNSITITKNQVKNILNGQCNSSPCLIKLYTLSKFTLYNANKILHKNCIGNPFLPNKSSLHVLLTPHLNGNDFSLSVIPWKIKF